VIARRPVTIALAALITTATGKPCGVLEIPSPVAPATRVDPPYYVLYSLDGGVGGPPFIDAAEDASFVYQVTCVSGPDPVIGTSRGTTEQAEWLADTVKAAILARDEDTGRWINPLTVAGVSCMCRELDTEPGATSHAGDAIIDYVIRFRFDLTPA
jgi:hypothetical protein